MSGPMTGADADAVRRLAARCAEAATLIDTLARSLRSRIYAAGWDGPDAHAFQRDWNGRHVPALTSVAAGLRAAGEHLTGEAEAQTRASDAGTARPTGAPPVPVSSTAMLDFLSRIGDPTLRASVARAWERGVDAPALRASLAVAWEESLGELRAEAEGTTTAGGVPVSYASSATLEARVRASAGVGLTSESLTAQASAGAVLAATLAARGRVGTDLVNVEGSASVSARASAEASARARVGPEGASVRAGGAIGARVEAGVEGEVEVSGIEAGGRATAYAGVDLHAYVEASFSADSIKAEVDVGAALGIGGGVSFDVEIDPGELVDEVGDEAERLWNRVFG